MKLYTIQWREPGYGSPNWVIERNLFQEEQRAYNIALAMADNRWNLSAFGENEIKYYREGVALFRDNELLAEYYLIEFDFNDF